MTLALGGDYKLQNCTFYGTGRDEAVALSNFASNGFQGAYGNLTQASFTNCIVYGGKNDEILLNNEPNASFSYLFENCLVKTSLNTDTSTFINCVVNQNPSFYSTAEKDFSLSANSPCIAAGKTLLLAEHLHCNPHNIPFDIGAIAFQ